MSEEKEVEVQLEKKNSSYTYWVNKDPAFTQSFKQDIRPVPLEAPPSHAATDGPSQWNKAGTWEEKGLKTADIAEAFRKTLEAAKLGVAFRTVTVEGEANIFFSKGKKRLSYSLKIDIAFGKEEEGPRLKYSEYSDDGDREFKVQGGSKDEQERLRKGVSEIEAALQQGLKGFL